MKRLLFVPEQLPPDVTRELEEFCRQVRGDIIRMTTLAGSGHPGGSMSSTEIYAILWSQAGIDPSQPHAKGRDRIIVSHGHTSPGVYAVLGRLGFFDRSEAVATFRLAGSPFEGHVERTLPGVELTTGNLGQGLSSACGMALADKLSGYDNHVWVVMGDGEQQKGQIAEARRFASAHHIGNLTVVIDVNGLQISGPTSSVMPQDLEAEYASDGWDVTTVDGHDAGALYRAVRPSGGAARPRLVLARTVMGRGVSFMENDEQYHGRSLTRQEASRALAELGLEDDIDSLAAGRRQAGTDTCPNPGSSSYSILSHAGRARTYPPDHNGDNRSAFGQALVDLADLNRDNIPLVFDCDLTGSVKTDAFRRAHPDHFFQSGIMEHHTASAAGGASLAGKVVFWADFGVFAADETYNQHRLNDINMTNLKVVATHCGLDVGPDGKTHHCLKYVSLMGGLPHCSLVVPADPNQTDRAVRYAATHPGNFFIAMGRSKTPVITGPDGLPLFGEGYRFVYGQPDLLRTGADVMVLTMGSMCAKVLEAAGAMSAEGRQAEVWNVSCPVCIGPSLISRIAAFPLVATVEDHDADSGLGARVAIALAGLPGHPPLIRLGVQGYGLSGDPADLYRAQGLAPSQIAKRILKSIR
jgi:transketolase